MRLFYVVFLMLFLFFSSLWGYKIWLISLDPSAQSHLLAYYKKSRMSLSLWVISPFFKANDRRVSVSTYAQNEKCKVLKFRDGREEPASFSYFLVVDDDTGLLKSDLVQDTSSINYYSQFIDIKVFNRYVTMFSLDSIEWQYVKLLSASGASSEFRRIYSRKDIDLIMGMYPAKTSSGFPNQIINIEGRLNSERSDDSELYWIRDIGVVRFTFDRCDGQLLSVDSQFIGSLGNEIVHL